MSTIKEDTNLFDDILKNDNYDDIDANEENNYSENLREYIKDEDDSSIVISQICEDDYEVNLDTMKDILSYRKKNTETSDLNNLDSNRKGLRKQSTMMWAAAEIEEFNDKVDDEDVM